MSQIWTQRHREEGQVKTEAETGAICLQVEDTKDCQSYQKLGGKHRTGSSLKPQGKPSVWTSGLQDCEKMHVCCFKPSSLWCIVAAALATENKESYLDRTGTGANREAPKTTTTDVNGSLTSDILNGSQILSVHPARPSYHLGWIHNWSAYCNLIPGARGNPNSNNSHI